MIDLRLILNNKKLVLQQMALRNFDPKLIEEVYVLGQQRSEIMNNLQKIEAERNKISREIGFLKSKNEDDSKLLQDVSKLKIEIEDVKKAERKVNNIIKEKMLYIPNLPTSDTPLGQDDRDNLELREKILGRGKISDVLPHYQIGVKLGILDFERAVKMSGTRFWLYKNQGAKLVRALENWMLDFHTKRGYQELRPPVILHEEMLIGSSQLPKFKADLFKIENQKSYLISTAEIALINYHHNEILNLEKILSYTAFTPCFRKEAGAGGKDMRGLIRAHQFNKVELVKFAKLEQEDEALDQMLNDVRSVLNLLEIPYREVRLCGGDLGFGARKTIDFEIWMPSEKRYREVSSVSTTGTFQARRAKIRYKDKQGVNNYAVTLNGSGLAIDRVVAAILENYQNKDGTISIPSVLQKYMNQEIIK